MAGKWSLRRTARQDRGTEQPVPGTAGDDSGRLAARLRRFAESKDPSTVLDPAALDEASRLWDDAMSVAGDPQMVSVDVLTTLGYLHMYRYSVLPEGQEQDDLRKTLTFFGLLVDRAPERIPDQVVGSFVSAGLEALDEYKSSGRPELLETAVSTFRDAVTVIPPGHPDRAVTLSNLGAALFTRFEQTGDFADLDAAITVGRGAVTATPEDHPNGPRYLSNLGNSLRTRYERVGDVADLDAAIDVGRDAVTATPAGHPDCAGMLSGLGASLNGRYEAAGDVADLDAAIGFGWDAVTATTLDHPSRPKYLTNLGNSLCTRYELVGDVADLDTAIKLGRDAVGATPAGHHGRAMMLSNQIGRASCRERV